jgi:hypothetical protein
LLAPHGRGSGLECLLEVLWACATPVGLRSSGRVRRGQHLLPVALLVLVSLVVVSLGRGGIIVTVVTTEVVDSLGFPIEVGLDHHLTGGVLGGDV